MKLTNFRNLAAATVVALGATGPLQADESSPEYTNEIAPGVFSYSSGGGYHSMFLVTDEGVVAFETVNTAHGEKMIEAIRGVTDQPIEYAMQSHNHWDHASGSGVFQAAGAETVMHAFAAEYLAANPGKDTTPADIVWDGRLRRMAPNEYLARHA